MTPGEKRALRFDLRRMTNAGLIRRFIADTEVSHGQVANLTMANEHWKRRHDDACRAADHATRLLAQANDAAERLRRENERLREALDYASRALNTLAASKP